MALYDDLLQLLLQKSVCEQQTIVVAVKVEY